MILLSSVALASGGGEHGGEGPDWKNFGWRVLNFAVLMGLLYWLLADKVKSFFGGRREDIKAALEEAQLAKEEAHRKFE
jgi:F-type H+-transporting ATPase subunit b